MIQQLHVTIRMHGIGLGLMLVIAVTAAIYWPGLSGGFLFDDYPNLEQLGARGPIESLELFRAYLSSGFSGPTGRPLSLASFLIDANDWPADPAPFKRTNLIIHLLTGLLLFVTMRKLLVSIGRPLNDASWISLLATGLWLVNPFLVSTTLYAVQRMTQLAALFSIAGIWCYLHGRTRLHAQSLRGYGWLVLGVPLCTGLATLSKENGALVPLLLLVMHLSLKRHWTTPEPARLWVAAFLWLPTALIVAYLAMRIPGAAQSFAIRDFTLSERLLSQSRFLWDYLYHLIIPHIQTQGLFQDGRVISTGLLEPWTTLLSIAAIAIALGVAWHQRGSAPLLSLAVMFFFAAHLLESTVIPLELYFEHRNYLPAAFLFLPIAACACDMVRRRPDLTKVVAAVSVLVMAIYSGATWQRASLWGNEHQLMLVWAERNPDSARAQVSAAQTWLKLDRPDLALATLDDAIGRSPVDALLIANRLAFRAELGLLTLDELQEAATALREVPFDAQAMLALQQLVMIFNTYLPSAEYAVVLRGLFQHIRDGRADRIPARVRRITLYLEGMLLAGQGRSAEAMPYFTQAFDEYASVDTGLRLVSDLAIQGLYPEALDLLEQTETLLQLPDYMPNRPKEYYAGEIRRLRAHLEEDIETMNPNH